MSNKLVALVRELLQHFDVDGEESPSAHVFSFKDGTFIWGVLSDEVSQLLLEINEIIQEEDDE